MLMMKRQKSSKLCCRKGLHRFFVTGFQQDFEKGYRTVSVGGKKGIEKSFFKERIFLKAVHNDLKETFFQFEKFDRGFFF